MISQNAKRKAKESMVGKEELCKKRCDLCFGVVSKGVSHPCGKRSLITNLLNSSAGVEEKLTCKLLSTVQG